MFFTNRPVFSQKPRWPVVLGLGFTLLAFGLLACNTKNDTIKPLTSCKLPIPNYTAQNWQLDTSGIDASALQKVVKGNAIKVALVTDGMDTRHCQLTAQWDPTSSYNYYNNQNSPLVNTAYMKRGTAMAGLIAAQNFINQGVVSVAPEATMTVYALTNNTNGQTNGLPNIVDAMAHFPSEGVDQAKQPTISINAWVSEPDDLSYIAPIPKGSAQWDWATAVNGGVGHNTSGKGPNNITPAGVSYLFSAGGKGDNIPPRDSNMNGYANYFAVMAICGVDNVGAMAPFSETGSNLLVCAPSATGKPIYTTDVIDTGGFNGDRTTNDFTDRFGSGDDYYPDDVPVALAGGALALLQSYANTLPAFQTRPITWWQWRIILAESATQVHSEDKAAWDVTGNPTQTQMAGNLNYHHSEKYGFGLLSVSRAKAVIDLWASNSQGSGGQPFNKDVTAANQTYSYPYNQSLTPDSTGSRIFTTAGISLADTPANILFTEVTLGASFSGYELQLISPNNIISHLIPQASAEFDATSSAKTLRFGSVRDMGATGTHYNGPWRLRFIPVSASASPPPIVTAWGVRVWGYNN